MKRVKFYSLLTLVLLGTTFFSMSAIAFDGNGTDESPYVISTQEELKLIDSYPSASFVLNNDIELDETWSFLSFEYSSKEIVFTGTLDGNGHTIKISKSGLFQKNNGLIKNLNVITTGNNNIAHTNGENGTILQCSSIVQSSSSNQTTFVGGISTFNYGTISQCISKGIIGDTLDFPYSGGIVSHNYSTGKVINSYFIGEVNTSSSSYSTINGVPYTPSSGGIAGFNEGIIENCYAVPTLAGFRKSGISYNNPSTFATSSNCFYDTTISGLTDTSGIPKTTSEMKTKSTYTSVGWDFENIWGIDENINDGYPYLLCEYKNEDSASVEIINAISTNTSLKFISKAYIDGNPAIETFGTTFIPLWLFETNSTDTATVTYNNTEHNIKNESTFGATLTDIPTECCDMNIVGKSFIKMSDGTYKWSDAKYSSVNDTTLKDIE